MFLLAPELFKEAYQWLESNRDEIIAVKEDGE